MPIEKSKQRERNIKRNLIKEITFTRKTLWL